MATTIEQRPAALPESPARPQGRGLLIVMIGIMLGILLSALDQTVVGPAMPKIIGELNGFEHYVWVFTAYMLTSTISVPIFGKLGDIYGRKWFFIGGIVIFLVGSMLCGLSQDIWQLIIFRGLQGLGGGILIANAFTLVGDLVPPADRGRWQGLFGGVWGLASVFGPTVGGQITDHLSWRWVFYVNLPVGIIALLVLLKTFPALQPAAGIKKAIDWMGAITLSASMVPLLIALSLGGSKDWAWDSANTIGLLVVAALFLIAFLFVEARAKEPLMPLDLFKNSTFSLSVISVFLTGLGMFGAMSYIPLFIQAVQNQSATTSGNAITPMMLSVVASSVVAGQLLSRTGKYRVLGVVGMIFLSGGMFLLSTMNVSTPIWQTIAFMMVMGLGLGVAMPLYNIVVQNAFPVSRLGVVTSAITFFRSIGGTVGLAILGAVVNNRFQGEIVAELQKRSPQVAAGMPAGFASNLTPQALVNPQAIEGIKQAIGARVPAQLVTPIVDAIVGAMKPALATATTEAFLIGGATLMIAIVATALLKEIPLRKSNERPGLAMAEGARPEAIEESDLAPVGPRTAVGAR